MKKLIISWIGFILWSSLFGQPPNYINYQATIYNAGEPIVNQTITLRFNILKGSISGPSVFSEKHNIITNQFGLVALSIGNGTDKTGDMITINWGLDSYFLKIEIDVTGGTNFIEMGTTQLLSVPYAFHAKTVSSFKYDELEGKPTFDRWDKDSTDNVIISQDQTVNGRKTFIIQPIVPTPVGEMDAVNKAYVDMLSTNITQINILTTKIKDFDGNLYTAIKIGSQIWMKENLRTTHYNDGESIPLIEDNTTWANLTTPGFCWYDNNKSKYSYPFGALYNFYTVETNKLCPAGWHVPSQDEWTTMRIYLGSGAGGKMKESGLIHWESPNTGATNESDFTALPSGYRDCGGVFMYFGKLIQYWASVFNVIDYPGASLYYASDGLGFGYDCKQGGSSVRCVKD